MKKDYYSNIELPDKVTSILQQDYWVYEHVNAQMLNSLYEPVKISSFTSIFVKRGRCRASINLRQYDFEGPCTVTLRNGSILHPENVSEDFDASFLVISQSLAEKVAYDGLKDTPFETLVTRYPVVDIDPADVEAYCRFYKECVEIYADRSNPYATKALLFSLLRFFFRTGYKPYLLIMEKHPNITSRLVDTFLTLAQKNFRQERFLDFYARQLEITPKHLSRTVKAQTGYTAVEWIERFVVLEAKALLKSSNLTIQQIAVELNFPSQSFFGKYFKKYAGMSPKEFRNS